MVQGEGQVPLLGAGLAAGAADCLVQRTQLLSWASERGWEFARRNGGDGDCSRPGSQRQDWRLVSVVPCGLGQQGGLCVIEVGWQGEEVQGGEAEEGGGVGC